MLYIKLGSTQEMFLFTSLDYVEGQGMFKRNEHNNLDRISTESVEKYYQDLFNFLLKITQNMLKYILDVKI